MKNSRENWALYNCIDGAVTMKVHRDIMQDVEQQGFQELYKKTMALFEPILFMQTIGLGLDHEALANEKLRVEEEIEGLEKKLEEACGFALNVNSPKQCQQYFYGVLGHAPYTSKTGGITTDDTAMSRLVRKGVKEAGLVQSIRNLKKLLSTYLEVIVDPDGRIRCSFNPRGTVSGRLSSSKTIFGTGFNFQNIDPRFKRFIKADPGRIFFSMDKAKAEWVITAYVCGDPKMISAIEAGEDIHMRTIHEMTGVPFKLIEKDEKLIGKRTDADDIYRLRANELPEILEGQWNFLPRNMSLRQCGKKTNHGCNYLESYRMFALLNEISEKDAKTYVNGYREAYIMLPMWWDRVASQLHKDRIIYDCFGHKRRFLGELNHDLVKAAVAHIPQASSVWVLNQAMIDIYNSNLDIFEDLHLHAQVHDELLFSYPIDRWRDMARSILRIETMMTPSMSYEGRDFTIGTDLAVGLYWAEQSKETPQGSEKIKIETNISAFADQLEELHRKQILMEP